MLHKKLLMGIAPLLAVAAFAVAPAMASAAPQWHRNGVLIPEGEHVPVATYGHLTLTASNGASVSCDVIDKGHVWNEGGVGMDSIEAFDNENCTSNFCPVEVTVPAEGLPWPSVLEEVAGVIRDKIGTAAKPIKVTVHCATEELPFTGTLTPKIENNTPSWAEFDAGSGELSGPGGLTAKVTGKDYLVGFENETITAE